MSLKINLKTNTVETVENPVYTTRAWAIEMSQRLSDGEPVANLAGSQGLSVDALRFYINRYYTQERPLEGKRLERAARAATAALEDVEDSDVDTDTTTRPNVSLERTETIIEDIRRTGKVTQVAKKHKLSRARVYQLLDEYYAKNPHLIRVSAAQNADDTDDKIAEWVLAMRERGVAPTEIVRARPALTLEGIAAIENGGRYGVRQRTA